MWSASLADISRLQTSIVKFVNTKLFLANISGTNIKLFCR